MNDALESVFPVAEALLEIHQVTQGLPKTRDAAVQLVAEAVNGLSPADSTRMVIDLINAVRRESGL